MTNIELADLIVKENENTIRDTLFLDGYMFDDQINSPISSPVARELPRSITKYFDLSKDAYVIRDEMEAKTRSCGVFYSSDANINFEEVKKLAKKHYGL